MPPAAQLLAHGGIVRIHVRSHQVVIVAPLLVHILLPGLSADAVQARAVRGVIPVHAAEALVRPDEIAVLACAARKGEARKNDGRNFGRIGLGAVVGVVAVYGHLFGFIRAHAMVEHDIGQYLQVRQVQHADGRQVFGTRSVLGAHRALLVKLTQVIGIIYAVSHIVDTGAALVGGRQPYGCKTHVPQLQRIPSDLAP